MEFGADGIGGQRDATGSGEDHGGALGVAIEEAFGVRLPPIMAMEFPTPASMGRYLAEQIQTTPAPA